MTGFERYVALGDSMTEGLDDPAPGGRGHLGFADRLAIRLARENPGLHYANLAVRGRKMGQIRSEQLEPALALAPDLATVAGGINDILRKSVDLDAVAADLEAMVVALRGAGATVVSLTFVDPSRILPAARAARPRILAFNAAVREIGTRHGLVVADFEQRGVVDPRLWSADRLHANAEGHRRIAAALTEALGLEPDEDPWAPLPATDPVHRLVALRGDLAWAGRHMAPWLVRRLRGRSSGDGVVAKRPRLERVLGDES